MAQPVERRRFIRKKIRMSCSYTKSSGMSYAGNTKDVSLEGVLMECMAFMGGACPVGPGDNGILTLRFKCDDKEDGIKVRCQVQHVSANGVGLRIRLNDLVKNDQDKLGQIIALGRAQIESETKPEVIDKGEELESDPPSDDL